MWEWVFPVLGGLAIIYFVRQSSRKYARVFSSEHYLEMAASLPALKQAALERIETADSPMMDVSTDSRILRTSGGLRMIYDIQSDSPDRFVHHVSLSVEHGATAGAMGQRFILLWALVLEIPLERLMLERTSSTIHHAEMHLSADEQREFAQCPVRTFNTETVPQMLTELETLRDRSRWTFSR